MTNNGEPFEGLRVPLGALVYYKPSQHVSKPPFEPRTVPGIFSGWRIDSGYKHRKIQLVLDYESLRANKKGCGRPIQVHSSEIYVPENPIFPLCEAERAKLQGGEGKPPILHLPFDEGAPKTPSRVRRTYVTLDGATRFGKQ